MIATERNYIRDLQNIVQVFYSALEKYMPRRDLSIVFSNIDELLAVNTQFYSVLESVQLTCSFIVEDFGSSIVPFVIIYEY